MAKITLQDLNELQEEVSRLIWASNKAEAKPIANKLLFKANAFDYENPCDRIKLIEAINCAKQASGQVPDKEHWISCYQRSWYVFERNIKCKLN